MAIYNLISSFFEEKSVFEMFNLILTPVLLLVIGYLMTNKRDDKPPEERLIKKKLPSKEETLKLIMERRSITPKDLNGDILSTDDIEYLMEAGNWAPTHHKSEPWRYIVISGTKNILDYMEFLEDWYSSHRGEVSDEDVERFTNKCTNLKSDLTAKMSHMFVICMKRQALPNRRLPEWEEICAVASSVQNIHLALTALPGCGGFWSSHTWCKHARDSTEFKEYLGLESEDRVFGAFMVGKVREGAAFRSTRSSWRDKVTWRTN